MIYENSVAPQVFTVLWFCSQCSNLFLGARIATLGLKTRERETEKTKYFFTKRTAAAFAQVLGALYEEVPGHLIT